MTEQNIIKQIESLYVEGDEPNQEIRLLCMEVAKEGCHCFDMGILTEIDEDEFGRRIGEHAAICDCITEQFKENK